jgi:hypothetical protein
MLSGRWEKFNRGEAHFKAIQDAVTRFADPKNLDGIRVTKQIDLNPPTFRVVVTSLPQIPSEWSLLIGETLYNVRGALDYLVWDLAILDTGDMPRTKNSHRLWRTQFPLCEDDRNGEWRKALRTTLKPLTPAHQAIIESFQPYHRWNWNPPEPLLALDKLSNADKHRALRPVVFGTIGGIDPKIEMRGRDCQVLGSRLFQGMSLDVGTELVSVPIKITGPDPEVQMNFKLGIHIAINNEWHLTETLRSILARVNEVLLMFEGELSSPKAVAVRERVDAFLSRPIYMTIDSAVFMPERPPPA